MGAMGVSGAGAWGFASVAANQSNSKSFEHAFKLDELGNWLGPVTTSYDETPGVFERRYVPTTDDPVGTEIARRHVPDTRNQIFQQTYRTHDHGATPGDGDTDWTQWPGTDVKYAYAPAGRMTFDGRALYEYDAFGRCVQVREVIKGLKVTGGVLEPTSSQLDSIGRLVVHYSYDALGRVVRTQRPRDEVGEYLAIDDLYSDSVRVVQEAGWAGVRGTPAAGYGGTV